MRLNIRSDDKVPLSFNSPSGVPARMGRFNPWQTQSYIGPNQDSARGGECVVVRLGFIYWNNCEPSKA